MSRMSKTLKAVLAAGGLFVALPGAHAQPASPPSAPPRARTEAAPPQTHAPAVCEQELAIAPIFSGTGTWRGEVPAGALGPNSPSTTSDGRATCRPIAEGHWYACDVQDRVGTGPDAVNWKGHLLVGWDRTENRYKATVADNMGSELAHMNGALTGNKLTLETPVAIKSMGHSEKQRLTFDMKDPKNIAFLDERQLPGQPWHVFERATIRVEGPATQARTPPRQP